MVQIVTKYAALSQRERGCTCGLVQICGRQRLDHINHSQKRHQFRGCIPQFDWQEKYIQIIEKWGSIGRLGLFCFI